MKNVAQGLGATFNGIFGLSFVMDYYTNKSAVIQSELMRAPELTDKVYEAALETSEIVSRGNLYVGIGFGTLSGVWLGLMTYDIIKKGKSQF